MSELQGFLVQGSGPISVLAIRDDPMANADSRPFPNHIVAEPRLTQIGARPGIFLGHDMPKSTRHAQVVPHSLGRALGPGSCWITNKE